MYVIELELRTSDAILIKNISNVLYKPPASWRHYFWRYKAIPTISTAPAGLSGGYAARHSYFYGGAVVLVQTNRVNDVSICCFSGDKAITHPGCSASLTMRL